jgi:hypothetical protein
MSGSEPEDRFLPKQNDFIEWFLQVTNEGHPPPDQEPPRPCTPPRCILPNLWSRAKVFESQER